MATRYWVGGSGNWSSSAHWSLTSGGAGGQSYPNSSNDNVFFDNGSGLSSASQVTLDREINVNNFTWNVSAGGIFGQSGSYKLICDGDFNVSGPMIWNVAALNFSSSQNFYSEADMSVCSVYVGEDLNVTFSGLVRAKSIEVQIGADIYFNAGCEVRGTQFIDNYYNDGTNSYFSKYHANGATILRNCSWNGDQYHETYQFDQYVTLIFDDGGTHLIDLTTVNGDNEWQVQYCYILNNSLFQFTCNDVIQINNDLSIEGGSGIQVREYAGLSINNLLTPGATPGTRARIRCEDSSGQADIWLVPSSLNCNCVEFRRIYLPNSRFINDYNGLDSGVNSGINFLTKAASGLLLAF